jgi:hypothetical protein
VGSFALIKLVAKFVFFTFKVLDISSGDGGGGGGVLCTMSRASSSPRYFLLIF